MDVGVDLSQHQRTWDEIVERARFAEEAGFSSAWVFDHFKPLYGSPDGPCFEGWTLLAALSAETERIRLGPLVTGVTYRHPSLLAAEVATVDHVSGGRINFGLGAAWFEGEHDELGFDFPPARERIGRLDEALEVVKLLWTEDRATFDGRYYRLRDASYNPKPLQTPHPPIWVGAGGLRRTIPIAARHADVWHGFGDVATLTRKARVLDEAADRAGREPSEIARSTSLSISEGWDEVRSRADELRDAGFTHLIVSWPSEGRARIEEFAATLLPELTTG